MRRIVDKRGIEIEPGDILKVFHFVGARRKRYYMYKMAIEVGGELYASHLDSPVIRANYPLWTGVNSEHYEIVQSNNWEKLP